MKSVMNDHNCIPILHIYSLKHSFRRVHVSFSSFHMQCSSRCFRLLYFHIFQLLFYKFFVVGLLRAMRSCARTFLKWNFFYDYYLNGRQTKHRRVKQGIPHRVVTPLYNFYVTIINPPHTIRWNRDDHLYADDCTLPVSNHESIGRRR